MDSFQPKHNKWLVTGSVMLGVFMSVMDITVVNVAMPHMMGNFGVDLLSVAWVSTAYSIAEIIMITMSHWWTVLLGRKRYFLLSMAVFMAGSILSGFAHSFAQIIIFRMIQGIGGGGLIPCAQAIARETFPAEEQGMAMAVFSMGVIVAPAIGPVLGGWLVDHYGWPFIFFINIPICILAIAMTSAFVEDPPYLQRHFENIDAAGIGLLTVGLSLMQIVLEHGEEVDWFSSRWICFGAAGAVVALAAFVFWELRVQDPVIDFRLLKDPSLNAGCIIGAVVSVGLYGVGFLIPQWSQELLSYDATQSGLLLLPRAAMMFCLMPLVGRLYNKVSPRWMVLAGIAMLVMSYWLLARLPLAVGFWTFLPAMVLGGAGMAFSMVALSTAALSRIPKKRMTAASGIYTLARRVSGNIAYAALGTVLARRIQVHRFWLARDASPFNASYRAYSGAAVGYLRRFVGVSHARVLEAALVNRMINRQASLMSYNDAFFIMAGLFALSIPLIVLLPRAGLPDAASAPAD
ncbi:MAG TPA: DHA2 family efflux MFS transporter permease subunit [Elusimicrobiota bacterium]|nr:DHA2 family efflux MFS transporter permease subunit [Elusimicrobiota bacterium]